MKPRKETMSVGVLRSIISYSPETGVFIWLRDRHPVRTGDVAGCLNKRGYIVIGIDGKLYQAHRLAVFYITGEWPMHDVDHRNRIKNDNRWENIRVSTRSQNNMNSRKRDHPEVKNRLKGTTMTRGGRWSARVYVNKKYHGLGTYDTAEEAHAAYVEASAKFYGEFARAE